VDDGSTDGSQAEVTLDGSSTSAHAPRARLARRGGARL